MYYRFNSGYYVEAATFEEAKEAYITELLGEDEDKSQWYKCCCVGFQHRYGCPELAKEPIPF